MILLPYAILDTDFISKLYATQNMHGVPLIEKIFSFNYEFCCHKQIIMELQRHNGIATTWLQGKVSQGKVSVYSDSDILNLFSSRRLPKAVCCRYYINHLRKSCEVYEQGYFSSCYGSLENNVDSRNDFLNAVAAGDAIVGQKHNLGEVKNTVLMMALKLCSMRTTFKFCSDDKDTRAHILAYAASERYDLKCISPFCFFLIAKNELALSKIESDEYFSSWLAGGNNSRVSVIGTDNAKHTQDVQKVYDDMWAGKVSYTAEGYIKY